jgi:ankyrin repeat protein
VEYQSTYIIQLLLNSKLPFEIENKSTSGETALHAAVRLGNLQIVKILIDLGANILTFTSNTQGNTPLHECCQKGNLECLQLLINSLKQKPDIKMSEVLELKNNLQCTPLMAAVSGTRYLIACSNSHESQQLVK